MPADNYLCQTFSWYLQAKYPLLGLDVLGFLKCYSLSRYVIESAHINECDVMQMLKSFGEDSAIML